MYNAAQYIRECLESILDQTYEDIEIIAVDDGSTDASLHILEQYRAQDRRIHVFTQKNQGASAARNTGIQHAGGDFICFIDADDTIDSSFLQTLFLEFSSPTIDFVFCSYLYNYNGTLTSKTHRLKKGIYSTESLLDILIDDGTISGILFGSVCTAMYRKKIIDKYSLTFCEDLQHNEDGLFNIEYCLHTRGISVLSDKYLYSYRQTHSSQSKRQFPHAQKAILTKRILDAYSACGRESSAQLQLLARTISEAFWDILYLCSPQHAHNGKESIENIKKLLSSQTVTSSHAYVCEHRMSASKRIYWKLMKKKQAHILYFCTRYIYPLLSKKMAR